MRELESFVRLSKYAGERFDLVQAGGGNSSVKLDDGTMLIKASGYMLSEVEPDSGYVKVKNSKVIDILNSKKLLFLKDKRSRSSLASGLLKRALAGSGRKPSIEIFLHSLLYKYTLHIHPLAVSAVICRKDWRMISKRLLADNIALVDYRTPGVDLALELKKVINRYLEKYGQKPKAVFLQNHGLIVSSDNPEEIPGLIEDILMPIECDLKLDLKKYKLTNRISALVNSVDNTGCISHLSCDADINRLIKIKKGLFLAGPSTPDELVYCGVKPLELNDTEDIRPLIKYRAKYFKLPAVLVYEGLVFFIAKNVKKAKEMESVFKAHLLTQSAAGGRINFLKSCELSYLGGWEDEKYRQEL